MSDAQLPWPEMDFSVFGDVETVELSRIQQIVAKTLARNWQVIPHVTHNDEADISSLSQVRKELAQTTGKKITPLAFMIKAAVAVLKEMPQFNSSLDASGTKLTLKKYFHIGFALDTPSGLLVPVIHDADKKTLAEIAQEVVELSTMARDKGLPMAKMQGGCFSISSLGSIGGTSFTPIINAPEVAIMGVTKSYDKACNEDGNLIWKTVMPLSLSYDHRVINGADAARFCVSFAEQMNRAKNLV